MFDNLNLRNGKRKDGYSIISLYSDDKLICSFYGPMAVTAASKFLIALNGNQCDDVDASIFDLPLHLEEGYEMDN